MAAFPVIQCAPPPRDWRYKMGRGSGKMPGFSLFNQEEEVQLIVALNVGEDFVVEEAPANTPVAIPITADGLVFLYARIDHETPEACTAHVHTTAVPSPYAFLPVPIQIIGFRGLAARIRLSSDQCDWFYRSLSRMYSAATSVSVTLAIPDPLDPSEYTPSTVLTGPRNVTTTDIHALDGYAHISVDWDAPFEGGTIVHGLDGYAMQTAAIAQDQAHHARFLAENIFVGMSLSFSAQAIGRGNEVARFPVDTPPDISFSVTGISEVTGGTAIADIVASNIVFYLEATLDDAGLQAAANGGSGAVIDVFANTGDGEWNFDPDAAPPHIASVFAQGQEGQIGAFYLEPESIVAGLAGRRYVVSDADVVANLVHRARALRSIERTLRPIENPGETRVYVTDFSAKLGQDGRRKIAASKEALLMGIVTTLEELYSCDLGRLRAILKERVLPAFVQAAIETTIYNMASCGNSIYREVGSTEPINFEQETVVDTWGSLSPESAARVMDLPPLPPSPAPSMLDASGRERLREPPSQVPGSLTPNALGPGSPINLDPALRRRLQFGDDPVAEEAAMELEDPPTGDELMRQMAGGMLAFSSRARPPPAVSDQTAALGVSSFVQVDVGGPWLDAALQLNRAVVSLPAYAPAVYAGLSEMYVHTHTEIVSFAAGAQRTTDGSVYGCVQTSVPADAGSALLSARLSAGTTEVAALAVFARSVRSSQTGEMPSASTSLFLQDPRGPRGFLSYPGLTNRVRGGLPMFGCEFPQRLGSNEPTTGGIASHKASDDYYLISDNPYDATIDTVVASQTSNPGEPMHADPLSVVRVQFACEVASLGMGAATLPTTGVDQIVLYPQGGQGEFSALANFGEVLSADQVSTIIAGAGLELTPRARARLPAVTRMRGVVDAFGRYILEIDYAEQTALEVIMTLLTALSLGSTVIQFAPDTWLGRVFVLTQASQTFKSVLDMEIALGGLGQPMQSTIVGGPILYVASELVAWMNRAAESRVSLKASVGDVFSAFGNLSFSGTVADIVSKMKRQTAPASTAVEPEGGFKYGAGPVAMKLVHGTSYAEESTTLPLFTPPDLYAVLVGKTRVCRATSLTGSMMWLLENTAYARGIARPDVYFTPWKRGSVPVGPAGALFDDLWESILVERANIVAVATAADGGPLTVENIVRVAAPRVATVVLLAVAYATMQNVFLDIDVRETTLRKKRQQMGAWVAASPLWYNKADDLAQRVTTILYKNTKAMRQYYQSAEGRWREGPGTFDIVLEQARLPGISPPFGGNVFYTTTMDAVARSIVTEQAALQR